LCGPVALERNDRSRAARIPFGEADPACSRQSKAENPAEHGEERTRLTRRTSDGTTRGGHLLDAHVSPTLEVMVTVEPIAMQQRFDPETDLTVIDPALK
jgi:hypothetical protein